MKILITGANGFIGKTLVGILKNSDCEIIPLVHSSIGFENEVITDFCDASFYTMLNTLPKVDIVVHLGAKVGWNNISRQELFAPNVLSTAILANWSRNINAYFVFASTVLVCGTKTTYITATSQPHPDTDYAYSKLLAEEMVKMSGVKYAILRISGVFGRNGPFHLGINKAIDNALNGMAPIQYGSGEIKRNYIYVKDLSNVIKFCIENKIEGTHLVAGSSVNTIKDMLRIICNILLPEKNPKYQTGDKGYDQIVEHSTIFPKGRSFEEAIKDIKYDYQEARASL